MPDPDRKQVVRQLVDEVMNRADLSALDDLYAPPLAAAARRWIEPFLASFSDVHMRIVDLVAEGETVVGRFTCSGTHTGTWLGHPATGRRFENVAEVYFFRVVEGRIVHLPGRNQGSGDSSRDVAGVPPAVRSSLREVTTRLHPLTNRRPAHPRHSLSRRPS